MIPALLLPRLLDRIADRSIMIAAALSMTMVLAALAIAWRFTDETSHWPIILGGWFALGLSYAASITPGGRLLRRSSGADDRPALFAAQFALSHVCWLIAYPLAGQRSEEHTSELQSLMRISYAGFCLKKKSNPSHIVRYP